MTVIVVIFEAFLACCVPHIRILCDAYQQILKSSNAVFIIEELDYYYQLNAHKWLYTYTQLYIY